MNELIEKKKETKLNAARWSVQQIFREEERHEDKIYSHNGKDQWHRNPRALRKKFLFFSSVFKESFQYCHSVKDKILHTCFIYKIACHSYSIILTSFRKCRYRKCYEFRNVRTVRYATESSFDFDMVFPLIIITTTIWLSFNKEQSADSRQRDTFFFEVRVVRVSKSCWSSYRNLEFMAFVGRWRLSDFFSGSTMGYRRLRAWIRENFPNGWSEWKSPEAKNPFPHLPARGMTFFLSLVRTIRLDFCWITSLNLDKWFSPSKLALTVKKKEF